MFAAVLLLIPAVQMILARPLPVLPTAISARHLSTRRLARLVRRIAPVLRWLEKFAHPRWPTQAKTTERVVGVAVALLALSILASLPLMHIIPALVIILIAFSFIEKDGVLLAISLFCALGSGVITTATVWATVSATNIF